MVHGYGLIGMGIGMRKGSIAMQFSVKKLKVKKLQNQSFVLGRMLNCM